MKKLFAIAFVLCSLTVTAQSVPVDLHFNITTVADTVVYEKANILVSEPYMIDTARVVKITVSQWKELAPGDVISRNRTIIAPANVTSVLSFDPETLKIVVNKVALNVILEPYNIQVL